MAETGKVRTRSQVWAERAFDRVAARRSYGQKDDYATFAKSFPGLIHTCGLVQALAFAEAKGKDKENKLLWPDRSQENERGHTLEFLDDLATVLGTGRDELIKQSREADVVTYLRLSREALAAAGWLKRYVEALLEDKGGKEAT